MSHQACDCETIDSELRLLVTVRRVVRKYGAKPSNVYIDALLDERAGANSGRSIGDEAGPPSGRKRGDIQAG